MIQKLKKQLYNQYFSSAVLIIPLICFFLFSACFNRAFFIFLVFGLLIIISYLIRTNRKIIKRKAVHRLNIQDIKEEINLIQAAISNDEASVKAYREKILNYLQLKGLTEKLGMCLYLDDTSRTLSSEVNRLLGGAETTIILYLFHSKTGDLGISSSRKGQMRINVKSKKGDIFDQWVVKTMQPLLIENTKNDYRFDIDRVVSEDSRIIRSLISVPMMIGNKALGILRVDSPEAYHFGTEELRFLATIGDLGAVSIENAQLYERVEQLAIKDGLTNLFLRRYLMDRMTEEVNRHLRSDSPLSFLMIDLDLFKQYNDKFGHVAGDIVLRTVGKILTGFFEGTGDLVCRYGGEEFAVLLPNCPKDKAAGTAEEIRKKISEQTILLRRQETNITVSVGVSALPDDGKLKEELIYKADQALYKAKNKGRNRVCVS